MVTVLGRGYSVVVITFLQYNTSLRTPLSITVNYLTVFVLRAWLQLVSLRMPLSITVNYYSGLYGGMPKKYHNQLQ